MHSLIFRMNFISGDTIELQQNHPGKGKCRWQIFGRGKPYVVFNPYINDLVARAMDRRFGSSKFGLYEYKDIEYLINYNRY